MEYFKSFYFSHTLKETQERFNISQSTIYKRLEKYGVPRSKTETFDACLARIDEVAFTEYYFSHTRAETLQHFDISEKMLCKLIKHYQISKCQAPIEELAEQLSKEELEEYYFCHSQEETRLHFNKKYNIGSPYRSL